MTPVDKLSAWIEGIYAGKKNIKKGFIGHAVGIVIDPDGFSMSGALVLHIIVVRVHFYAAGITADHTKHTFHFLKGRCDAPEAATGKIGGFHSCTGPYRWIH